MNVISIGSRLWFDETPMGGTLNFLASEGPEGIRYQVGISFQSLATCSQVLRRTFSCWTIRDGSFSLYGDKEEMTLHFAAIDGSSARADFVLRGKELQAFRYAVSALVTRPTYPLN